MRDYFIVRGRAVLCRPVDVVREGNVLCPCSFKEGTVSHGETRS